MKINIENYRFTSKRLTGDNLKLFFVNIKCLHILLEISTISMKLKRPEINNYQEVFIYKDETAFDTSFRAISEKIVWRNFDKSSIDDINY